MSKREDKPHIWLGKYLSLSLTLPAAVFAGYILGSVAKHFWHSDFFIAAGILIGMAGGIVQVVRELTRDEERK